MKNRKWITIYSDEDSISAGILTENDKEITIMLYAPNGDFKASANITTDEARDFITFLETLIADIENQ